LRGEIDVYSFGADGQPGGTGVDADIGSWDL
jgi:general secretion pathway protein G